MTYILSTVERSVQLSVSLLSVIVFDVFGTIGQLCVELSQYFCFFNVVFFTHKVNSALYTRGGGNNINNNASSVYYFTLKPNSFVLSPMQTFGHLSGMPHEIITLQVGQCGNQIGEND